MAVVAGEGEYRLEEGRRLLPVPGQPLLKNVAFQDLTLCFASFLGLLLFHEEK